MRKRLSGLLQVAIVLIAISPLQSSACIDFYHKLPNVSKGLCEQAQLRHTSARSVRGRPIQASDVSALHATRRVLVVAAMHGDELSAASLALHWLRFAQGQSRQTHWRFVPVLNPDGLMHSPAQRMNAHGVDLNRNFPTPNWLHETQVYWERRTRKDPRRWPGPSPLSEPEARFLMAEMRSFQPQVVVSIHAPYGVLDFDGPVMPPARLGRLYLKQVGVFPGSLGNYSGVHQGVPVVTVELPSALRTPTEADMRKMWNDLNRWINQTLPANATLSKGNPW